MPYWFLKHCVGTVLAKIFVEKNTVHAIREKVTRRENCTYMQLPRIEICVVIAPREYCLSYVQCLFKLIYLLI